MAERAGMRNTPGPEQRDGGWQSALPLRGRWLRRFFIGVGVALCLLLLVLPKFGCQGFGPGRSYIIWQIGGHELELRTLHQGLFRKQYVWMFR